VPTVTSVRPRTADRALRSLRSDKICQVDQPGWGTRWGTRRRFLWLYLLLALAISFLSYYRQRKSFYYAGLLNTGTSLWFITEEYEWFDRPAWAVAVVVIGLAVLVAGFGLAARERQRRAALASATSAVTSEGKWRR